MVADHEKMFADKKDEGMIAIRMIQETMEDIVVRRKASIPDAVAAEMSTFAHGQWHLFIQTKSSEAALNKIEAMVKDIIDKTRLNRTEINELIMMLTDSEVKSD